MEKSAVQNPQKTKKNGKKISVLLFVGLIDIVALIADGTTISDWLQRSGYL